MPNTSSEVVFSCHVHLSGPAAAVFGSDHDGDIPVCLPADLNRWIGSAAQVGAIDAMPASEYDDAVATYGREVVKRHLTALKALDLNGRFCGVIQDAAQDPSSHCGVKLASRDAFCESAANYAPVTCVPNSCHDTMARDGSINAHACTCNTVVQNGDDCNLPGDTMVIAPTWKGDRRPHDSG